MDQISRPTKQQVRDWLMHRHLTRTPLPDRKQIEFALWRTEKKAIAPPPAKGITNENASEQKWRTGGEDFAVFTFMGNNMADYAEHEFATLLAAWPGPDNHIIHLYELDPTHVAVQPAGNELRIEHQTVKVFRSSLPFCLLADESPSILLLEIDPTHREGR